MTPGQVGVISVGIALILVDMTYIQHMSLVVCLIRMTAGTKVKDHATVALRV